MDMRGFASKCGMCGFVTDCLVLREVLRTKNESSMMC
jgi:hypothetical protein